MKKKQQIENRPNYYNGQLLLKEDFLAEQSYHISARHRHNQKLHGSGVVRGLEVVRRSDTSVTVQPGYAIDDLGREIFLDNTEELDLSEFGANDIVNVSLMYQDGETAGDTKGSTNTSLIVAYAVITVATVKENQSEVLLATVKLDSQKKVVAESIDYSSTKYAGAILAPGSVGVKELAPELKTGWLTMPFRPIALVNIPDGEDEIPPSFRVGATEALSPKPEKTDSKDKGAAGNMAIAIPPYVNKIIRFRIAGSRNEGKISFSLLCGGWDTVKKEHVHRVLVEETISGAPFMQTYDVYDTNIEPEYSTLSLWLRCTQRTAISLIAVEVGY
jgi:hypothetical protein